MESINKRQKVSMMEKGKLSRLVESQLFNKTVSWAIIFCSVLLGIETNADIDKHQLLFKVLDISVTVFFIIEIILRILAEDRWLNYFHLAKIRKTKRRIRFNLSYSEQGVWNWFDFIIVVISTIAIFSHFFEHAQYLLVARMFRIFRIFRLLEISSKLREVEKKIITVVPTVFSFGLLLLILIYIYAIIGFYLFDGKYFGSADFSSLPTAAATLFQVMTLDGWGELMGSSLSFTGVHPVFIYGYYISFVVFSAIVSLNVFIAVMASSVEDRMNRDLSKTKRSLERLVKKETDQTDEEIDEATQLILAEIRLLREEVNTLKNQK